MELARYTLMSVAKAVTQPTFVLLLFVMAFVFYRKNKKTAVMQKMIIGESLHSAFELTISQIVLGILAGALGSLMMSYLGVVFNENSAVYLIFLISILLMFFNPKYICFSYSGAILGLISIISQYMSKVYNIKGLEFLNINIVSLMVLVGVLHIIEGMLVLIDGDKGAIPIFANRNKKIIGGFALKRHWALPIAIFIMFNTGTKGVLKLDIIPNWWPIIKGTFNINFFKEAVIDLLPLYCVIGYSGITFTKTKRKKSAVSGALISCYGAILVIISQMAVMNLFMKLFVVIFAPLAHEVMIRLDKYMEFNGEPKYVSSDEGIMILDVAPNSPAYEMGIESGDLLMEINNRKISIEDEIFELIRELPNFIWFKIKKETGELKEVSYNKMNKRKRLGIIFVPKQVPLKRRIEKYENNKFKDILEKMRNEKDKK